ETNRLIGYSAVNSQEWHSWGVYMKTMRGPKAGRGLLLDLDVITAPGIRLIAVVLALVALTGTFLASAVEAQPVWTDSFTGAAHNGDANDKNNWDAGRVPGAEDDVCIMPPGSSTQAFIGAYTFHSMTIGGDSSFAFSFGYGSASVATTL